MSSQLRPSHVHKHFHYHYHYDETTSRVSSNLQIKQNMNCFDNFQFNNNKNSWKDYLNPEINKIYDKLCMKQSNSKFDHFKYKNESQTKTQQKKEKIYRIKKNNFTSVNKSLSHTSLESLKDQIKQHQLFIKKYTNNENQNNQNQTKSIINLNDNQTKSMINLNDNQRINKQNQHLNQPLNHKIYSRITPINSIDQLSYKRTDSRIDYNSKPTQSSITPLKRQSIRTQNDFQIPQNKTLMSLMTRGSESSLKLSINQQKNTYFRSQNSFTGLSQQIIQNEHFKRQQQSEILKEYQQKQNRQIVSSSLNYENKNFQFNIPNQYQQAHHESYRNRLIREQCQYLRNRYFNHCQQNHGLKI